MYRGEQLWTLSAQLGQQKSICGALTTLQRCLID